MQTFKDFSRTEIRLSDERRNHILSHPEMERKAKRADMDSRERAVKLYYDPEGDYMEVIFESAEGYFRQTSDDRVMEKVDPEGNVLGFSVMALSSLQGGPFEVAL